MIIKYTDVNDVETPFGSQIKVIDTKESGNIYTYSCISMTIQFFAEIITISGQKELTPVDSDKSYKEPFELYVTNNSYRNINTFNIVSVEEALDENGNLKEGYMPEFNLFVSLFGHNAFNQPNKIYPFIVDAITRKFNLI